MDFADDAEAEESRQQEQCQLLLICGSAQDWMCKVTGTAALNFRIQLPEGDSGQSLSPCVPSWWE